MTTVVYCLAGYGGSPTQMPPMLQGSITNGNTVNLVSYQNWNFTSAGAIQGAAALNTAMLATGGDQMIAFGHSFGAVAIRYWLAIYGPTSAISTSKLSCILLGDSANPYGGFANVVINWFPGSQIPANNPYPVTSFIKQYDGWADWPQNSFNLPADTNALSGQALVHVPGYMNVTLASAAASFSAPGNTTYQWALTWPTPSLGTTVQNSFTAGLDALARPGIESAYSRPCGALPTPSYGDSYKVC